LIRNPILIHLAPLVWAGIIFVSSSIPSDRLPPVAILGFDKLVHFGIYFVLCWLVHRSMRTQRSSPFASRFSLVLSILLTVLYGASDEFHQSLVPGRDSNVYDLISKAIGGGLYAGLYLAYGKPREKQG
jgi:VanZ family protein